MNLKNWPPVFVPGTHRAEVEKLSKAALMDMVWDYAKQIACSDHEGDPDDLAMKEFRERREIILTYRERERERA